MNIPGTVIPAANGSGPGGCGFLSGIFTATSGLMLSQVREITGLDAPALQNWVKRGWVSPPIKKRYGIDQVARILIINMLRGVFSLESIAFLLSYINGRVDDLSDDIIPESVLYEYFCRIITESGAPDLGDRRKLHDTIDGCVRQYKETIPGAAERLRRALEIMVTGYSCACMKDDAEHMLDQLRE